MTSERVVVPAAVPAVAHRWIDVVAGGQQPRPETLRLLQVGGARRAPEIAARVRRVLGADCSRGVRHGRSTTRRWTTRTRS